MTIGKLETGKHLQKMIKEHSDFLELFLKHKDIEFSIYDENTNFIKKWFDKDQIYNFRQIFEGENLREKLREGIIDLFEERIEYLQKQFDEL